MGQPKRKQTGALYEALSARVESLSGILSRPHSADELEPEILALGDIVRSIKGEDKAAGDKKARASARGASPNRAFDNEVLQLINKSNAIAVKAPLSDNATSEAEVENRIIAKLPEEFRAMLTAYMERVTLQPAQVLYQEDQDFQYVYFPETAVVSLFSMLENGASVGVGMIGNEGLVGIRVLSEALTIPYHAVVQKPGTALKVKAPMLREGLRLGSSLQPLLLDYTQGVLIQICQLAACNQLHSLEQKLVRWLLMMQDRVKSDTLLMTQDLLASMIGARRAGVTVAARTLQETGVISYRRGIITIMDRARLEQAACECYRVIKQVYDRLIV
jgi:CRP-like cAMP-binding protein